MKQVLIALLTLTLALAFAVFACWYVRDRAAGTLSELRLAQVQAGRGDFENAADAVLAASQRWHANERFFDVVLRHDEVDAVSVGFASLQQYAQAESRGDFAAACAELIERVQRIRQMQLPLVSNIL